MAKTIKFNLICDGTPIRTLDDLRANFSVEDILEYYNNGLLQRWLDVRGYYAELEKLNSIAETEPLHLISRLSQMLGVETDAAIIEKNTYIFEYSKQREEKLLRIVEQESRLEQAVDEYWNGYQDLIQIIEENKDNFALIKASVEEIAKHYERAFALDYRMLFYRLKESAPKALFAMLMCPTMRGCYLPMEEITISDCVIEQDKQEMYQSLCSMLTPYKALKEILGDTLCEFSGKTESYWKDIEPKEKKCMILKMEKYNFVRAAGVMNGDLSVEDVNNRFIIIDGIDYKSAIATDKLLYIEV